MMKLTILQNDMAWPFAILIAWMAGEFTHRWVKLSRISAYAIVGFLLAPSQLGLLPATQSPTMLLMANISAYAIVGFLLAPSQLGLLPATQSPTMLLMANIAFGLILFELTRLAIRTYVKQT